MKITLRPYKKINELKSKCLKLEEQLGHANTISHYWYQRWSDLYWWIDKKRYEGLFGPYDNKIMAKRILGEE